MVLLLLLSLKPGLTLTSREEFMKKSHPGVLSALIISHHLSTHHSYCPDSKSSCYAASLPAKQKGFHFCKTVSSEEANSTKLLLKAWCSRKEASKCSIAGFRV